MLVTKQANLYTCRPTLGSQLEDPCWLHADKVKVVVSVLAQKIRQQSLSLKCQLPESPWGPFQANVDLAERMSLTDDVDDDYGNEV